MTPSTSSSPCDRLMIWCVVGVVIASLGFAFALEFSRHAGASAAFIGVAVAALGILSPSPLKQHNQGGSGQSVEAPNAETVNVSQPVVPPPVTDPPPAS